MFGKVSRIGQTRQPLVSSLTEPRESGRQPLHHLVGSQPGVPGSDGMDTRSRSAECSTRAARRVRPRRTIGPDTRRGASSQQAPGPRARLHDRPGRASPSEPTLFACSSTALPRCSTAHDPTASLAGSGARPCARGLRSASMHPETDASCLAAHSVPRVARAGVQRENRFLR